MEWVMEVDASLIFGHDILVVVCASGPHCTALHCTALSNGRRRRKTIENRKPRSNSTDSTLHGDDLSFFFLAHRMAQKLEHRIDMT
jgi:hypothetical protein